MTPQRRQINFLMFTLNIRVRVAVADIEALENSQTAVVVDYM